jgi:hypothetical protein
MFAAVSGTDANDHLSALSERISGPVVREEPELEDEPEAHIVTIGMVVKSIVHAAKDVIEKYDVLRRETRDDLLTVYLLDLGGAADLAKNLGVNLRTLELFLSTGGRLLDQDVQYRVSIPENVAYAIEFVQSFIEPLDTKISEARRMFAKNQLIEYARTRKMTFDQLLDRRAEYHEDRLPMDANDHTREANRKIYTLLSYFAKERELERTAKTRKDEAVRMAADRKEYLDHARKLHASGRSVVDRAKELRYRGVLARIN